MGVDGSGCSKFIKYGLFIFNLFILIGGIIVFGLSLYTLVERNFLSELLGTNLFSGAVYVLVITSALTCLLAFLGCFGALREIKCMLLTYSILLFLIFVTMLIGGILAYIFREKVELTMQQEMYSSIKMYESRRQITQAWDLTQSRLRCCGVKGHADWRGKTPKTCCLEVDRFTRKPCEDHPNLSNVHNDGCYEIGARFIREQANIIGASGIALSVLMLLAIVFSCIFFNMIE